MTEGGTAGTNPYKRIYDLRLAEGLAKMEMLNESKLWSPKFTPSFFGKVYLPIVASGVLFCLYIHYVQIPKNMLRRRRLYGTRFPDLERKGFLDNWMVEDYHDDIYSDEVLKEMELLTHSTPLEPVEEDNTALNNAKLHHETMLLTNRARMSNTLTDLYTKRKQLS